MANILSDSASWLAQQQRTHASSTVYYVRGASSAAVLAVTGRSQFDVTDGNGILTRVDSHDFLILATDLVLASVAIEPAVGDRIVVGTLSSGQAYEVAGVGGGDCWRWSDDFRLRYRIHTKHVGAYP